MAQILVVDDEEDIRLLYADELSDEGHTVATAGTCEDARKQLESDNFDLVILDIQMKNESGLDLLKEVVREKIDLPVILCTAYSMYKDDFSSWLADAYIVKSSDLTELKNQVSQVLKKRRKQS